MGKNNGVTVSGGRREKGKRVGQKGKYGIATRAEGVKKENATGKIHVKEKKQKYGNIFEK